MLNFGIPTLIESPDMKDCAKICNELGLQFVELNMNLPQYEPEMIDIPRIRSVARDYGIFYTLHLDENLNPWDFNVHVQEAYTQTVIDSIRIAKELDITVLNMHLVSGVYFTLPDKRVYLFDVFREHYLDTVRAFRDKCHEAIGDSGVKICIENTAGYPAYQQAALDALLESPVFGLTLDIGHNHGSGYMDEPFITDRIGRLEHMHIHDAVGKRDHLVLGSGDIDLQKYFTMAKNNIQTAVIETKTLESLRTSIPWMRENIVL